MSRIVSSLLPMAALAALTPALAQAASTPTRVGLDEEQQVSFNLTGRNVTVTLRPTAEGENQLVRDLADTKVVLACSGKNPKTKRTAIGDADATWTGGVSQQFRLSKDISYKPKWCVLERPQGTDLAVTFKLRVIKTAE